jgi:uncharacterized protein (TIGR03437 family)
MDYWENEPASTRKCLVESGKPWYGFTIKRYFHRKMHMPFLLSLHFVSRIRTLFLSIVVCAVSVVSWSAIPFDATVRSVAVDPSDPNRMYALTVGGILKTDNRGQTWEQIPIFPIEQRQPSLLKLQFDMTNPSVIYVLADGENDDPLVGIWRSVDRGANWERVAGPGTFPDGSSLADLLVASSNGSILYARVTVGSNVNTYRSTNGGSTWAFTGQGAVLAVSPHECRYGLPCWISRDCLALAQRRSDLFAGRPDLRMLRFDGINAIAISPANPNIMLVSMTGASIPSPNGIYRSVNGGAGFQRVVPSNSIGVAFNPLNPSEVIASDCCGLAIRYSKDGGQTFEDLTRDLVGALSGMSNMGVPRTTFDHGVAGRLLFTPLRSVGGGIVSLDTAVQGDIWKRVEGTYTPIASATTNNDPLAGKLLSGDTSTFNTLVEITAAEGSPSPGFTISAPQVAGAAAEVSLVSDGSDPDDPEAQIRLIRSGLNLGAGVYDAEVTIPVQNALNSQVKLASSLQVVDQPEAPGVYLGRYLPSSVFNSTIYSVAERDGKLYIGGFGRISVIHPDGSVDQIAGTGSSGDSGDGGPATEAQVGFVRELEVAPDGTVYFHDSSSRRIRRIRTDGIVETVAGTANSSAPSSITPGAAANSVRFITTPLIALRSDGDLIVAHSSRLWRLTNGFFQLVAGGGSSSIQDGAVASQVSLSLPSGLVLDDQGQPVFINNSQSIYRLRQNGTFELEAGASASAEVPGSNLARDTRIRLQSFLLKGDEIYFITTDTQILYRVEPDGVLRHVGLSGVSGSASACTGALYAPNPSSATNPLVSLPNGNIALTTSGLPSFWIPAASGDPGPMPGVPAEGVVHAASFQRALSPGSLVSIFGTDVAGNQAAAAALPLPSKLGDGVACVAGQVAPMIFASPLQLNVQLPFGLEPGTHTLRVFNRAGGTTAVPIEVQAATPEIFRDSGRAVVINPNGSVNAPGNGVSPGQVVVAYLTGIGDLEPAVPTGDGSPLDPLAVPKLPRSATVGGASAALQFLGMTPGFAGLAQANVQIPDLAPGEHQIVITVGNYSSEALPITVQ